MDSKLSVSLYEDEVELKSQHRLQEVISGSAELKVGDNRLVDRGSHGESCPPLTFNSMSGCFRLFFGSNVTVFPFYCARLGGIGLVSVSAISGIINAQTMLCLHRARHNLTVIELRRRLDLNLLSRGVDDNIETFPIVKVDSSQNELSTSPAEGFDYLTDKECAEIPFRAVLTEDIMPYFLGMNSMIKLGNELWPNHWMRHAMVVLSLVSQFFTCCNMTLLMGKNLVPVVGLEQLPAIALCGVMSAMLTMSLNPKTQTYLAHFSNFTTFGGGAFLLFVSLSHEQTEQEKHTAFQLLPKSATDFIIYAPSVLMFLAAPILSLEEETLIANRIHPYIKSKFEFGRGLLMFSRYSISSTVASAVSTSSPTQFSSSSPSSWWPSTQNPSLLYANIIQKYYSFMMKLGLLLCIVILLIFAELVLWCFKDNTNSVIALSLPASTIRTTLLVFLTLGLYACVALNLGPICGLFDSFGLEDAGLILKTLKRSAGLGVFFAIVVTFLWLIPFFDLVAALSSTIRGSTLVFFMPTICEIQSEILRASAREQNREHAAKATFWQRFLMGFKPMPLRSKMSFIVGMVLGMLVLFVSTTFVVLETIRRQREDS